MNTDDEREPGRDHAVSVAASRRTRPSLKDVAAETGLSIKTVSRALRGEVHVATETRRMVLEVADRLGVQVNDVAAGLRRKSQSMTSVGVMLGDFANPFFAPMLRGIGTVAAQHGHLVLTAYSQNDPRKEREAIRALIAHRVAGLIIAPSGDDLGYLLPQVEFGLPVVVVDAHPGGLASRVDAVTTTNAESMRAGVQGLIDAGHRRIAYLGHPRCGSGSRGRWLGYRAALEDNGIAVDETLVRRELVTEQEATDAADHLLSIHAADAVVVDNNRLCTGLLRSAAFAALRPQVLGFDAFSLAEQFGITVVDSDPHEVGRIGAEMLFDRLADPGRPIRHVEVPARLMRHGPGIY